MFKTVHSEAPTKEVELDLPAMQTNLALSVHSEKPVILFIDGIQNSVIPAGRFHDVYRFSGDVLTLKSQAPFTFNAALGSVSVFEDIDDRPVPERKRASNLLMQMREEFRRSMGVMREHFADDTPFPGYEIDDDDRGLFEEEMAAEARAEAKKAAEKAKAQQSEQKAPPTANSAETGGDSQKPDEGSQAPADKP